MLWGSQMLRPACQSFPFAKPLNNACQAGFRTCHVFFPLSENHGLLILFSKPYDTILLLDSIDATIIMKSILFQLGYGLFRSVLSRLYSDWCLFIAAVLPLPNKGINKGTFAGIVLGAVAIAVMVTAFISFLIMRRKTTEAYARSRKHACEFL